jgi:hypothetical protein
MAAPRSHAPAGERRSSFFRGSRSESRRLKLVARIVPVECEAQCVRARLHPPEMPLDIGNAVLGIEAHRLDKIEAACRIVHKGSLRKAFAPFRGGFAVGYYPGAEPHQSLLFAMSDGERSNRNIERSIAIGAMLPMEPV